MELLAERVGGRAGGRPGGVTRVARAKTGRIHQSGAETLLVTDPQAAVNATEEPAAQTERKRVIGAVRLARGLAEPITITRRDVAVRREDMHQIQRPVIGRETGEY